MRAALPLLALLVALEGCGYRFVRYQGALGDVRRVAIQTLQNDSFDPGANLVMADALRREFLRRGALEVVDDPSVADLVIGGAVLPIETDGQSFSSVAFSLEYRTTLRLTLRVARRDGTVIPLDERSLTDSELYLASADVEVTRKNREEALRRSASVIAGRIHDALFVRLLP